MSHQELPLVDKFFKAPDQASFDLILDRAAEPQLAELERQLDNQTDLLERSVSDETIEKLSIFCELNEEENDVYTVKTREIVELVIRNGLIVFTGTIGFGMAIAAAPFSLLAFKIFYPSIVALATIATTSLTRYSSVHLKKTTNELKQKFKHYKLKLTVLTKANELKVHDLDNNVQYVSNLLNLMGCRLNSEELRNKTIGNPEEANISSYEIYAIDFLLPMKA